jgi:hypothetical protein
VLSQDEPKAWVWLRSGSDFPRGPEVVAGGEGVLKIAALSIELPLSEVYADFPPPDGAS